jgi:energy-coupling factor transporter ATP-binding protein EcfA2
MSAIRWNHVSHDFGQGDVLSDVSLAIEPGESVALLGHNGAGKTTLTRMLVGLVRPVSGSVSVGDWSVAAKRPDEMASRVGYAFQHADQQLFARSVREDVAFGPKRLGRDLAAVDEVLEELRLTAYGARHPYDLPAPLRKLVTLAGVLAMQTPVVVFDEPTAGFDRELRDRVAGAVRRRLERGVTMLYVSHDRAFVDALARRRVVLEGGKLVRDSASAT